MRGKFCSALCSETRALTLMIPLPLIKVDNGHKIKGKKLGQRSKSQKASKPLNPFNP